MKITTVAIIGHSEFQHYRASRFKLKRILCTLIEEENAETFLFNGRGAFNYLVHSVVTELKEKFYPLIERVYVKQQSEKNDRREYFKEFDETYFPYGIKDGGYYACVNRNHIMVDMCDILLICTDKVDKKGTKTVIDRALKMNKKIINLYEQLK